MSAKCSKCRELIFDEDGQCYGEQLPGGEWVCDEIACENAVRLDALGASLDRCLELLERIPSIITKQKERLDILSDTLHLHTQSTHNKEAAAIMAGHNAHVRRHDLLLAQVAELERQDWQGLMAHLHTMWHELERRFDEQEERC